MKAKIAVAQMNSGADAKKNLDKMCAMTKEAKAQGADLILFPEHADYLGHGMRKQAQLIDGELIGTLSACAALNRIYLHLGSFTEKSDTNRPYNTSVLFDRDGKTVATYRKTHLFEVDIEGGTKVREADTVSPGDQIVVCDTDFGRVGFAICYDLRFPQLFQKMAKAGADIICMPANFTYETGKAHWEVLLRARAIENTCYIVAADQVGEKPEFTAYGHSMIIDAWGNVLTQSEQTEGLIYATIDLEYLKQVRRQMPSLHNTREDLY
ncbi:MAG: carbon-nitrogen hydrolase family protein [Eubacterium sp.]|nr:carbon-nitrogen hydrolase family protein [Eubacterium sp.]